MPALFLQMIDPRFYPQHRDTSRYTADETRCFFFVREQDGTRRDLMEFQKSNVDITHLRLKNL